MTPRLGTGKPLNFFYSAGSEMILLIYNIYDLSISTVNYDAVASALTFTKITCDHKGKGGGKGYI